MGFCGWHGGTDVDRGFRSGSISRHPQELQQLVKALLEASLGYQLVPCTAALFDESPHAASNLVDWRDTVELGRRDELLECPERG
jgi:hypothetical protein